MLPPTHVLYLHGFRSSPQSFKARLLAAHMAQHHPEVHWWCPQLPPSPHEAMALVSQGIAHWPKERMAVLGSSLGGFYATWVAEQTGSTAVLLNPAVDPARDLEKYIGQQTQWHAPQEAFYFHAHYVQELRALTVGAITRSERYYALICQGDEVLDWQEMHARYAHCAGHVLPGGDHAISDFAEHMPDVLAFLGLD